MSFVVHKLFHLGDGIPQQTTPLPPNTVQRTESKFLLYKSGRGGGVLGCRRICFSGNAVTSLLYLLHGSSHSEVHIMYNVYLLFATSNNYSARGY